MPDPDEPCVCGSGQLAGGCCGPILAGEPARTALTLMRSRYTAYVRGAIGHVFATTDPAARAAFDHDAALSWSRSTSWMGLEIVATERGEQADDDGTVEFIARGVTAGTPFAQHERSRFRRIDGAWYYVDGTIIHQPAARTSTAGRNDPCPCGSGQKYKRCHG